MEMIFCQYTQVPLPLPPVPHSAWVISDHHHLNFINFEGYSPVTPATIAAPPLHVRTMPPIGSFPPPSPPVDAPIPLPQRRPRGKDVTADLARQILDAYRLHGNVARLAREFDLHINTCARVVKRFKEHGEPSGRRHGSGGRRKLNAAQLKVLEGVLRENHSRPLRSFPDLLVEAGLPRIHTNTLKRYMANMAAPQSRLPKTNRTMHKAPHEESQESYPYGHVLSL
ncbi:hypothetical protein BC937DRAFT_90022 [Endogone sp. FLAS-F59071]|nr:hypothetical protein BC937DRAFT_90022 [Endogone sp. FLAS-F59071]|eukprot:RUS22208.1 hypothetical protein BC937DRAFT_90022 [Endogone sp. FLAS-F59071]